MLTYDERCAHEIKSKNATSKAKFMKGKKTLHQNIRLKFKEETSKVVHWEHSFAW